MKEDKLQISSFSLHILAMAFMLCDHLWATVVSGNMWLNFVGRLAFPIFAFMISEGYFYTHNFKKYMQRMFIFALISEIPFNLMNSGSLIDPFHQNVMWTFIISLFCINSLDKIKKSKKKMLVKLLKAFGIVLLGVIIGTVGMVDYFGAGVLTVIVFYLFHGRKWYNLLGQAFGLYFINFVMLQNMDIPFHLFGHEFFFPTQGFAIFALIPIWLYRGKQGPHNKLIKYMFYAFYPAHILILSLIALWR